VSPYQLAKIEVLSWVPVSRDVAHVFVGLSVLSLVLLFRWKRPKNLRLAFPSVTVALLGEALDAFDAFQEGSMPGLFPALRDIFSTTVPALSVLACVVWWQKRQPATSIVAR
jgi:hypothetical protein